MIFDDDSREAPELPEVPGLDERFAARVLSVAKRELVPAEQAQLVGRVAAAARGALVPALLGSAAACRTVLTIEDARALAQDEQAVEERLATDASHK